MSVGIRRVSRKGDVTKNPKVGVECLVVVGRVTFGVSKPWSAFFHEDVWVCCHKLHYPRGVVMIATYIVKKYMI